MFDELLQACNIFRTKIAALSKEDIEAFLLGDAHQRGEPEDAEQASLLAEEIMKADKLLKAPQASDKQDMVILLKRSINALNNKDILRFISGMTALKSLAEKFAPEKLDQEFADFILDDDTWNWIEGLKTKTTLDKRDTIFLSILKDNLLFLSSKMS